MGNNLCYFSIEQIPYHIKEQLTINNEQLITNISLNYEQKKYINSLP